MTKPFPTVKQDPDNWNSRFLDADALREVVANAADYADVGPAPTTRQVANVISVLVDLEYMTISPSDTAWSKEPPSTEGHYWYLCSNGDTGLIEIDGSDGRFYNGETSESVGEMTEAWGITCWCGPLHHPPIPSP